MQDGEPLAPRPVSTRVHHYPATTRPDPPCSDLYPDSDHHDVVPERIRRGPDVCQCRWLPLTAHAELSRDACDLGRSEEHTSELQSLMLISSAVFFLKNTT